jgi:hypothetical protein
LTAEVKESEEESKKKFRWTTASVIATVFGTLFGLVGAVAAAAVFFVPTRDGRDEADRAKSTASADTTQNPSSPPANPSGTIAPTERHLAELPLAQGGGSVSVVDRRDLSMSCGSGQSDDRYRQIEYELPGPYTSFTTRATAHGKADVEARVGVQVFVRARQERSDRTLEGGRTVLKTNGSEPITADITNARAILLRITCSTSTLTVTFTDPRIGR